MIIKATTEIAWTVSNGLIDYPVSLKKMKARVDMIQSGDALEQIWLLQHPPLYTVGTSANQKTYLMPIGFQFLNQVEGGSIPTTARAKE